MASTSASQIRAALTCGRSSCQCSRPKGNVHCPTHDDPGPSLSVNEVEGKVLVKCHARGDCTQDVVLAELKRRGLWQGGGGPYNTLPARVERGTSGTNGSKSGS